MVSKRQKAFAWTWLCDFGLCYWSEPTKKQLTERGKPSPEAVAVRVELVPTNSKYRA